MDKSPALMQRLSQPLQLPCGAVLKNRLGKSAMSDSLGNGQGDPTPQQQRLYERWAQGGIALSVIGEVQVDPRFPEKPGNLVLGADSNPQAFAELATRGSLHGTHLWPQLGHAGALSHPPISQPMGPSALHIGEFQCSEISTEEIRLLPQRYAEAAGRAQSAGFGGVLIHAAHGFLLSQFLSPLFNLRSDGYGGSTQARCRILLEVIAKVRSAVGTKFPIGIKINATDMLDGGLSQDQALEIFAILNHSTVDLIDISAGTYFPGAKANSDGGGNGPYFLEFAKRARSVTDIPLMLTGGFKTKQHALDAICSGAIDMVGLARAMVLDPGLPELWLGDANGDPQFPRFDSAPPGGITAWYTLRLTALGEDLEDSFTIDLPTAIKTYEERDAQRCLNWQKIFSSTCT